MIVYHNFFLLSDSGYGSCYRLVLLHTHQQVLHVKTSNIATWILSDLVTPLIMLMIRKDCDLCADLDHQSHGLCMRLLYIRIVRDCAMM